MRISDWSSDVCSSDLTRLAEALKAADTLEARGLSTSVIDLRFAKPLDEELIRRMLTGHEVCVTIEEGSIGGLGAHVLTLASDEGLIDAGQIGRASGRERVCQDGEYAVVAVSLKKKQ